MYALMMSLFLLSMGGQSMVAELPTHPTKKVKKKAKPSQSILPPKASSTLKISALLTCAQRQKYFEVGSLLLKGSGATFGEVSLKAKNSPYTSSLPGFSKYVSYINFKVVYKQKAPRFHPHTVSFTAHKGQNKVTCTAKITQCGSVSTSTTFTCK